MKQLIAAITFFFLIFFSLLYSYNSFYERDSVKEQKQSTDTLSKFIPDSLAYLTSEKEYKIAYDSVINYIKDNEGFRSNYYNCPAGQLTIGYGHKIRPEDGDINAPISEEEATILLKKDFQRAINHVRENTDLMGSQELAIAHFIFCVGIGTFLKSSVKKKIDQDKPIDVILQYNKIKTEDTIISSKRLLGNRQFELNLYNNDIRDY